MESSKGRRYHFFFSLTADTRKARPTTENIIIISSPLTPGLQWGLFVVGRGDQEQDVCRSSTVPFHSEVHLWVPLQQF